ncbi:YfdX family protein [Klebsiella pneumoniae]
MLTDFNQESTMKKVILASLLATMMSTSPVWATDSATAAPAAAATTQVQKEAADDASWAKFVKTDAKAKMIADRYVIINASIALSEDYVATPEKESAIQSANEKLAKGDQKGAIDTLRLAGIGVIENQYLMPLNQTRKAVAQAQELLKAGKYYEANLVLKGAEEGIVVDSEMLVAGN